MNFKCFELEGAIYQPCSIITFNDYWIVSACKKAGAYQVDDCRLILVTEEGTKNTSDMIYFFVLCYQFLFSQSNIYHSYSHVLTDKSFIEQGHCISLIEQKIRNKYCPEAGGVIIDFDQIDIFHTGLFHAVNFKKLLN